MNANGYRLDAPPGSLGAVVDFKPRPKPYDERITWAKFALIAGGTAAGLIGFSVLACALVARVVAKSVETHLRSMS